MSRVDSSQPKPAKPNTGCRVSLVSWFARCKTLNVAVDVGTGPVIVLLHGIASSAATFTNLFPLLAGSYRVIAIDLLGFGESASDANREYSLDDHVNALARTIEHLHLRGGFILAGHSMGALIAARYAATRDTTATRLILISPPIYPPVELLTNPVDRAGEVARMKAYRLLRGNKQTTIDLANGLERVSPIKGILDLTDRNWDAFERSLANAIEIQTTIDDIRATALPVDIVVGTADPFVLPAGIRLAEQYPNVTVRRIAGADHLIRPRTAAVIAELIEDSSSHTE